MPGIGPLCAPNKILGSWDAPCRNSEIPRAVEDGVHDWLLSHLPTLRLLGHSLSPCLPSHGLAVAFQHQSSELELRRSNSQVWSVWCFTECLAFCGFLVKRQSVRAVFNELPFGQATGWSRPPPQVRDLMHKMDRLSWWELASR